MNPARMTRAALRGAFLVCALLGLARAGATRDFTDNVAVALHSLDAGQPDDAVDSLRLALRQDANNPAPWLVWGAALLNARRPAAARRCFTRAATLAPDSPRPAMGLALCDLAEGETKAARTRLDEAKRRGSPLAAQHLAYLAALEGGKGEASADGDATGILSRAVRAYLADGNATEAAAAWAEVLPDLPNKAPLLASFTPWKPFNHGWQARDLPEPPAAPSETFSGVVPINPVVSADTRHVAFTVDGVVAGATNVPPYRWQWDTSTVPDGWHTLVVSATRADGSSISRERRIITRNDSAPARPRHPGLEALDAALDRALSLTPDARFARIKIARAAVDRGDVDAARRSLSDILADDPKYWNAPDMLRALPPGASPVEIWSGPPGARRIALTFDDGPNPKRTPPLLNLLDEMSTPATFFLVGKQAAAHPEMVRRMARSGHAVENHTWNHFNLARLSEPEVLRELASTTRTLTALAGRAPKYFRPPGGNTSGAARRTAAMLGMSPAMWSFASGKIEGWPIEDMLPALLEAAHPGAIYLIHNGTDKILHVLPKMVEELRRQGYEFVTLDVLMSGTPPG